MVARVAGSAERNDRALVPGMGECRPLAVARHAGLEFDSGAGGQVDLQVGAVHFKLLVAAAHRAEGVLCEAAGADDRGARFRSAQVDQCEAD